ncbi:MAG: hypothetical protein AAF757_06140 [Cyanobacteria bacterium P01_D01_bin.116]
MTEQATDYKPGTNGKLPNNPSRKGRKKNWKDLDVDPLEKGFDSYQAEYIVGRSAVPWLGVSPGQLFSRNDSGRNLFVKMNDGRAISLDTRRVIEIKPTLRPTMSVWLVTSFNSISTAKPDF